MFLLFQRIILTRIISTIRLWACDYNDIISIYLKSYILIFVISTDNFSRFQKINGWNGQF